MLFFRSLSQTNSTTQITYDWISHYPIVCNVFSFAIAKTKHVFRNTTYHRQSSYSTKSSAIGLHRQVVVM